MTDNRILIVEDEFIVALNLRQIIEDNHGGKVNFSSKYKIGSETQIILPIALEKVT